MTRAGVTDHATPAVYGSGSTVMEVRPARRRIARKVLEEILAIPAKKKALHA